MGNWKKTAAALLLLAMLSGCTTTSPSSVEDGTAVGGTPSQQQAGQESSSARAVSSASVRFKTITYFVISGSSMMKVDPLFSSLSARISPSCRSTICRTMDRPRPVPPVSRERALSTR